jgi:hypothetical protein
MCDLKFDLAKTVYNVSDLMDYGVVRDERTGDD